MQQTTMEDSKQQPQQRKKNYRKRSAPSDEDQLPQSQSNNESDDERERRMALEEIKLLQKQRERKSGILANPTLQAQTATAAGLAAKPPDKNDGDGADKDELVLQDTFAQETAVMVEDPNMCVWIMYYYFVFLVWFLNLDVVLGANCFLNRVKYIELELAKKRGRKIDAADQVENELKRAEDELYKIPEHLKVKRRNSEESSTQWTTGIAEVQLPIEYKLKNIEETEAAKKLLQEKRLMGRTKSDFNIPASYSADYFQRGRDYAEKLRREHPELYKDRSLQDDSSGSKQNDSSSDAPGAVQRQAATDEFMLERFRKRERHRVMRR
ncbi:protein COP1 SUPPRESSOR 2 isoform X1 [Cajanus cajan]|nr:protein COP1 SUPPRESSOR 2 isoform X1 [Cajanus cajan]